MHILSYPGFPFLLSLQGSLSAPFSNLGELTTMISIHLPKIKNFQSPNQSNTISGFHIPIIISGFHIPIISSHIFFFIRKSLNEMDVEFAGKIIGWKWVISS
jgi:hypothetical protein